MMSSFWEMLTGLAIDLSFSTAAATAFWIPRFKLIASAPAARFLQASLKIASARTVAVVVPSPATLEVLLAASRTSLAPIFSVLSSKSTSSATVTPSLVTVGLPHPLSIMAFRPRGPRVDLTAAASFSTPASNALRASVSNANCFAAIALLSPDILSLYLNCLRTHYGKTFYANQIPKQPFNKQPKGLFSLKTLQKL